jgi:hypothetical protein
VWFTELARAVAAVDRQTLLAGVARTREKAFYVRIHSSAETRLLQMAVTLLWTTLIEPFGAT